MLAKAFAVDNLLMVARLVIGVAVVVASDDDDDAWLAMGLEDTDSDERHLSLFLTATAAAVRSSDTFNLLIAFIQQQKMKSLTNYKVKIDLN